MSSSIIIGWREWVSLPELGIPRLKTKVDTGARTSALHACCVEVIEKTHHQKQVCFIIHPQPKRFPEKSIKCIADLIDIREITDSGGHKENRCVIQTSVVLGTISWPIEITLTSRDNMRFRMLLGRTALEQRFIVDPTHSYLYSIKNYNPMKIAILSRRPKLYSTRRLEEEAKKRGHQVKIIDTLRCYMNITTQNPYIHYKGKILDKFDAIIPRIGASITFYGAALVRQFEMMGVFVANNSISITRAQDKLRSLQILSRKGVGLPITGFAYSPDDIQDLISMVGGPPLVIKILEGTQGIGVVLAETQQAAISVIEAFLDLQAHIMVQEYIKEAKAADIRCFVVNSKVIAAMERQAKLGEFRSNIHRGGTVRLAKLTAEERATAVRAAKVIGLNIAGVDLLRSNRGPLVMEVNSSPGLEGIEKATQKNVAEIIIKSIEKRSNKH